MQCAHSHLVASTHVLNDNAIPLNRNVLARKTTLYFFNDLKTLTSVFTT